MSKTLYLSDIIGMTPDGILAATIKAIGEIEENKNGTEFRKVTFLFPSTGKEITEGVFQFNFNEPRGNLVGLKVGDTVEMKLEPDKNGKLWPIYKILSRSITEGAQPSQSNSQQVKSEKVASNGVCQNDEKSIAISLQGFMQAFIIQGINIADALDSAVIARESCINKAKAIQLGIPPVPTHSPEKIAEVNAVFNSENYNG